jgi:hypothetical protein
VATSHAGQHSIGRSTSTAIFGHHTCPAAGALGIEWLGLCLGAAGDKVARGPGRASRARKLRLAQRIICLGAHALFEPLRMSDFGRCDECFACDRAFCSTSRFGFPSVVAKNGTARSLIRLLTDETAKESGILSKSALRQCRPTKSFGRLPKSGLQKKGQPLPEMLFIERIAMLLYHVWTARRVQVGLRDTGCGSNAVMCPAFAAGAFPLAQMGSASDIQTNPRLVVATGINGLYRSSVRPMAISCLPLNPWHRRAV